MNLGIMPLEERVVLDAVIASDMGAGAAEERKLPDTKGSLAAGREASAVEDAASMAMEEIRRSLGMVVSVSSAPLPDTPAASASVSDQKENAPQSSGEVITDSKYAGYVDAVSSEQGPLPF